jgi:hypothetical protein
MGLKPVTNKYGFEPGDILIKVKHNYREKIFNFLTGHSVPDIKIVSRVRADGCIFTYEVQLESIKEVLFLAPGEMFNPDVYQVWRVEVDHFDVKLEALDLLRMYIDLGYNYFESVAALIKFNNKIPRHGLEFDNKMIFSHLINLVFREAGVVLLPEIKNYQMMPHDFRKSDFVKNIY